ncbi:MAG: tail fiber domain-containing protein [Bacteroidales bacterium]|jgi:hypothetical protein|nr:tail fiber domain-containing protein [Bacteroidales bacterium]
MKKKIVLASLLLVASVSYAQLEINNGNVGIGVFNNANPPLQKLHVDGSGVFNGNVGIGATVNSKTKLLLNSSIAVTDTIWGIYSTMKSISNVSAKPMYGAFFKNEHLGPSTSSASNLYGIHLENTNLRGSVYGIYANNVAGGGSSGYSVYGYYAKNSTSGYGGSAYGIYTQTSANQSYGANVYGIHTISNCSAPQGSAYGVSLTSYGSPNVSVFGVYSSVSGGNANTRYSGYFTGGKVLIDNDLQINLDVYARQFYTTSDERLKSNIQPLTHEINKLYQLQGKSYQKTAIVTELQDSLSISLRTEQKRAISEDVTEFGYLSQELQKVFPELVHQDAATGYYAVNYTSLIPLIVEALKEQRIEIEKKQIQIDKLQEMLNDLNTKIEKITQK